ncbi:MAG: anhydro-N-acetylmuramic acid kinase [Pseudomonadota bacterium]
MWDAKSTRVLGAMSGTSLDGVDAAVIETDGTEIFSFGETAYRPYTGKEQELLRGALGSWPSADLEPVAELIETAHAEVLAPFENVALIGFHGQTLAHDPANKRTHQLGDGQLLADALAVPVVWDFRTADVALGGQGAPLAPFFHFACARSIGASEPIAFLNLGGVANLTWIDPRKKRPEDDGALLAFDTGPANAPLNDLMMDWFGEAFDKDGETAAQGSADAEIIETYLKDPFFARMPPKSLDRGDFLNLTQAVDALSAADAAATLVEAIAVTVSEGLKLCPALPEQILVTGGGRKNPAIMKALLSSLDGKISPVEEVGLNGDMLEAQAFAYLAMRVARGLPTSSPSTTGVAGLVGGGVVSYPSQLD